MGDGQPFFVVKFFKYGNACQYQVLCFLVPAPGAVKGAHSEQGIGLAQVIIDFCSYFIRILGNGKSRIGTGGKIIVRQLVHQIYTARGFAFVQQYFTHAIPVIQRLSC